MRGIHGVLGGCLGAAVVVCAAAATVPSAVGGEPDVGDPTCVLEAGILTIDPGFFELSVTRAGDRIVPRTSEGPTACDGGPATVGNVDRVVLPNPGDMTLNLNGGPFAPGATNEGDGSSEIEFRIRSGVGTDFFIKLGDRSSIVRGGGLTRGALGLNLNGREATPDSDIRIKKTRGGRLSSPQLLLFGQRGADVISARGGPEFRQPFTDRWFVIGGPGADLIRGASKSDAVAGGRGRDTLVTGKGQDFAFLEDGRRDSANCGPGHDRMVSDSRDRTRSCRETELE